MRTSSLAVALIVTITLPLFVPPSARAQLGFYQLPASDFIWRWGQDREGAREFGFPDIEMRGGEGGFNCDLRARLRPTSNLSPSELTELKDELRGRLDFIYAVSDTMNRLDYSLALDWATLDCKKLEAAPVDEAERAERESRARDKMLRELERRRARQQRDDDAE